MACPYFHAVKARSQTDHSRSAMLPLGDAWEGICRAIPEQPWEPGEATLLTCCNLGYARGCCARFPDDTGPDAVRFTITGDDDAGIHLYYVLERNHHPLAHGPLTFSAPGAIEGAPAADGAALRLAVAYVASYRRRKLEACGHTRASR